MKDMSLGDRMKSYYESIYNIKLPMRIPIIIRLDGKAFHTLTKGLKRPFDTEFINLMNDTTKYLCENIQGVQLAYTQSDEISLLLHNYKKLNSQAWFGNEIQKIVSISASLASSYFTKNIFKISKNDSIAQFDSRVFVLPENEVCNYFIWRQQDWERNSIQLLAQSLYSHKELHKKNCTDLQEMCWQKDENWNNLDTYLKRGRCVTYDGKWSVDNEIPVFKQNRLFIEDHLKVDEI